MMGRNRFVTPSIKHIEISDGDWIEVKAELDTGDQRKQDALALVPVMIDGNVQDRVDWSQYEILRAHLWLTDWSLTKQDAGGKTVAVPLTVQAIRELQPEDFEEINSAIFAHIMEWLKEKKLKRKLKNPALPDKDVVVT